VARETDLAGTPSGLLDPYDTGSDAATMGAHRRHKGPFIGLRIVHLNGGQIRLAVVAANGPQFAHVGGQGYSRSLAIHGRHQFPGVRRRFVALDRA